MPITDRKSAEEWLENQSREVRVVFAVRAALRATPFLHGEDGARFCQIDIPTARAILTAGVAVYGPTPAVRDAAAAYASAAVAASDASDAAAYAADAAAYAAVWRAVDRDAEMLERVENLTDLYTQPLWSNGEPPDDFTRALQRLRVRWREKSVGRSGPFWLRWYDGMERGAPIDWDLQTAVALIDDDLWKQTVTEDDDTALAEEIARIEAQFAPDLPAEEESKASELSHRLPLAERIVSDLQTGLLHVVPIRVENPKLIAALLQEIDDCLKQALRHHNILSETSFVCERLRKAGHGYRDNPQQLELTYVSVARALKKEMDSGDLPETTETQALLDAVEDAVRGIRGYHRDVEQARLVLAQQTWKEMGKEGVAVLKEAEPLLTAITGGILRDDFARDLKELMKNATNPPVGRVPPLSGVDESYRLYGRVAKMEPIYQRIGKQLEEALQNEVVKGVAINITTAEVLLILQKLVELGLRLLGVI